MINEEELVERLVDFLRNMYYNDLLEVAKKGEKSLTIDFSRLDIFDGIIADQLLEEPDTVLNAFKKAVSLIDLPTDEKIEIRIKNIPERQNIRIRSLRAEHLNKFICIEGIVKTASEVKPQIYEAIFECPECGNKISVEQTTNVLQQPLACDCGRRGTFTLIDRKMYDIRWLKISEPYEVTTGEQPGEISVFLKEDLTTPQMQRKTDPGNRLKITGILRELPKRLRGRMSTSLDIYLEANHIEPSEIIYEELEISPEEEKLIKELAKDKNIYKKLVDSIAPGIYGFEEIKEAIVLQLFGGVPHIQPDGTRIRGNIHILITGDPGIGKTQLLKFVSQIVPRGKYVSGKGVSGVGLTASVRKDEFLGSWVLEAGALILCNKGLICIDEFDKMSSDDQIAMHEAMSVETVSIAKASIVATLPAQTSVLAGANPKRGRFDPYVSIAQQIDIPETLLSRFDLKFALRDVPDADRDEKLTRHIISSRMSPETVEPPISPEILRKYIAYARKIENIELTPEASDLLQKFYVNMRNAYTGEQVPTVSITLRQYEALIRLAEASAKIRLDTKVTVEDAERAIRLMKYSLQQLGYDYETGKIDIDKIESGVTTSQRSKIRIIMEIIDSLQKELGKEISIEDLKAEAESQGIKEKDTEDILRRLKEEGTVFEPRPGFIRKV